MGQENIQQTVDRVLDKIAAGRKKAIEKAGATQNADADITKKEFKV